jgi:hypothetical protein
MSDKVITSIVTIAGGILSLAVLALLVSKQANTPNVITSLFQQLACALQTAVYPVTLQKPTYCSSSAQPPSTGTYFGSPTPSPSPTPIPRTGGCGPTADMTGDFNPVC